ncbi:hypothetical protein Poli38472_003937 [Pythium oligandrum]|uniref:Uncharacterized protein n=1 Tax=Pythium oligandrum TaxID=41045 RepID=A0A8K1CMC0_PYTOL|nr:hypothetical protein Poli38472_003937 [Pythium oligandrum]|eukprot:TMW66172.1 hypothetical protein Poli38472_003937 [Pythium oligandrum]
MPSLGASASISAFGKRSAEAHVVVIPPQSIWYEVLDRDGDYIAGLSRATIPLTADVCTVEGFINAVRNAIPSVLPAGNLSLYSSKKAFNEGDLPLEYDDSTLSLGIEGSEALAVVVQTVKVEGYTPPRKKMKWNVTNTSFKSCRAESTEWPKYLTLDAHSLHGFGVSTQDVIMYCRRDVHRLFGFLQSGVLRAGEYGYVYGPPGSGKSIAAAAFVLTRLDTSQWGATWIHLRVGVSPSVVRIDGSEKKVAEVYPSIEDWETFLSEVDDSKKHVVFVDGIPPSVHISYLRVCEQWLKRNASQRRLVVLPSISTHMQVEKIRDPTSSPHKFSMSLWRPEDYIAAVEDDAFFHGILPFLDAGSEVNVSDFDSESAYRQAHVRSKYYFAGSNALWMFRRTTMELAQELSDPQVGEGAYVVVLLFLSVDSEIRDSLLSRFALTARAIALGHSLATVLSRVNFSLPVNG